MIAGLCLLPPTILMGATLPAIARWLETTPQGVSWLGFFYGGNIAGAVVGSLLAGFYLLRVHDTAVATYVAVGLNVAVALLGLAIARATPYRASETAPTGSRARARRRRGLRRDRAVGHDRARGRSDLDADPVAALRRDDLHVLADSGGVSRRPRDRQQPGFGDCAQRGAAARGAGVVSAAVVRRDCVDGARADAVAAVLADQSVDFERPLVHDAARSGAMPLGGAAGRDPLGRELSAGAGVGGVARTGSGPAGRRRLRRQHRRRDRRRADRQPAARGVDRQPACAAGADHPQHDLRAAADRTGSRGRRQHGATADGAMAAEDAVGRRRRPGERGRDRAGGGAGPRAPSAARRFLRWSWWRWRSPSARC